jgi:DNA ligase-1
MDGRTFLAEDKFDGIRAQIHKRGDEVVIYTRTMERCEDSYPDVVAEVRKLPGDFLLDGEIVPYADGAVLPFAHIQRRLGRKVLTPKIIRENPLRFIAFDILYRDGQLLMDLPLRQRREQLEDLLKSEISDLKSQALLSRAIEVRTAEEIDAAFCTARDCRNEGLVLKDPDSPYTPGRRGQAWLKLKTHLPTVDCVVTAAETGHGKRRNWLSDYTFAVWDRRPGRRAARQRRQSLQRRHRCRDRAAHRAVHAAHGPASRPRAPGQAQVVLEIAADQIQKSTRHASGYALRFPRIKRIRWDKRPEDADCLQRVIEIYESNTNFARGHSITPAASGRDHQLTLFD